MVAIWLCKLQFLFGSLNMLPDVDSKSYILFLMKVGYWLNVYILSNVLTNTIAAKLKDGVVIYELCI